MKLIFLVGSGLPLSSIFIFETESKIVFFGNDEVWYTIVYRHVNASWNMYNML